MKRIKDNDKFVTANFEEIIKKYSGRYIAVNNSEVFTGEDAVEKAEEKYPQKTPLFMRVPNPKFFAQHFLL